MESTLRSRLFRRERSAYRRARALLYTLHLRWPELMRSAALCDLLVALGRVRWIRPLQELAFDGEPLTGIARYLTVRYPVAPHVEEDLRAVVRRRFIGRVASFALLAHVGQGGSLRDAQALGLLPACMTRREGHAFLTDMQSRSSCLAYRRAQVVCAGGELRLADAVHAAIGGPGRDEARLAPWIRWFAGESMRPQDAALALEYLRANLLMQRPAGRSLTRLLLDAQAWHIERYTRHLFMRKSRAAPFPASGLRPLEPDEAARLGVDVVELRTPLELYIEGRVMRHCAASYRQSARSGRCALWSMRVLGVRTLTVEVDLRLWRVVQCRGRFNRLPTAEEKQWLAVWMRHNQLGEDTAWQEAA